MSDFNKMADVIEQAIAECAYMAPEGDIIDVDCIQEYANRLRQQAKDANDFAESEIKRFQENQRAKEIRDDNKSTTEIIASFLSHKDPLTELNKIRNVLDVLRDDAYLAATGEIDLNIGELHSMLDTSTHNLDEVIEFLTAIQAEVNADMQVDDMNIEFMKAH